MAAALGPRGGQLLVRLFDDALDQPIDPTLPAEGTLRLLSATAPAGRRFKLWKTLARAIYLDDPISFDAEPSGRAVLGYIDSLCLFFTAARNDVRGDFARPERFGRRQEGDCAQGADVAVASRGYRAFVWREDARGPAEDATRLAVARGRKGRPRITTLDTTEGSFQDPEVEIDMRGRTVVAWIEHRPRGKGIRVIAAATSPRDRRPRLRVLSTSTSAIGGLELAMNDRGDTILVWRERLDSRERVRAAVQPAGGGFRRAVTLVNLRVLGVRPVFPDHEVEVDAHGRGVVLWSKPHVRPTPIRAVTFDPDRGFGSVRTIGMGGAPDFAFQRPGEGVAVWLRSAASREIRASVFRAGFD